jgi:MoaA/NifB/PqqE/SkfB family radical SAM enzyme
LKIKELTYYLGYGFNYFILRKKNPVVAGIGLTDVCNLQCKHCVVANSGRGHYTFEEIIKMQRLFYDKGARILYMQGGEPFGWADKDKRLNDLVREAKAIGYFKVAIATNGTFPIETEANAVWISIDGVPQHHDEIRGNGIFQKVMENIKKSSHPNICFNMTINSINYKDVKEVVQIAADNPKIRGISVNFHTPYPGVEELFLPMDKRKEVIQLVIELKKQGYPILNSVSALKALSHGNYDRPSSMIQMVEGDKINVCCWGRDYGNKVCEKCGYGIIAEFSQIMKLKPDSLVEALKLFK